MGEWRQSIINQSVGVCVLLVFFFNLKEESGKKVSLTNRSPGLRLL